MRTHLLSSGSGPAQKTPWSWAPDDALKPADPFPWQTVPHPDTWPV